MCTALKAPAQWAQDEFGLAQLDDQHRNKRLVKIAEHLAANPAGTLLQAFPDWAELKAAYRFFGQRGVSFERIITPHLERTGQACRLPGVYLLIEDSTLLDYSHHPAIKDLGVISDGGGRGFELHSTLAVQVSGWNQEHHPEGQ
ncbi:MAG TPA: transposase DNA-binding-containing protein, partial [Clostridia bacterium]|nr:transposase DNA-binding-containing protein [Clostridia bacterium]